MKPLLRILLPVVLLVSAGAHAKVYQSALDQSSWALQGSPFACRLTHRIPEFGAAVLERGAGDSVRFWFEPVEIHKAQGRVQMYNEPPAWRSGQGAELVAQLDLEVPSDRIEVAGERASKVLSALEAGLQPTLRLDDPARSGWVASASPANFTEAYKRYLDCVAGLLPVNFEQIARTAILYPPAQWELSEPSQERLKLVKQYIDTDKNVTKIYIDGHSDASGRRLINRDLSKRRAEAVTDYLLQLGVSEEMLVTRYHGERYPVVPNDSSDNRTRNRRVTIRLERTEP